MTGLLRGHAELVDDSTVVIEPVVSDTAVGEDYHSEASDDTIAIDRQPPKLQTPCNFYYNTRHRDFQNLSDSDSSLWTENPPPLSRVYLAQTSEMPDRAFTPAESRVKPESQVHKHEEWRVKVQRYWAFLAAQLFAACIHVKLYMVLGVSPCLEYSFDQQNLKRGLSDTKSPAGDMLMQKVIKGGPDELEYWGFSYAIQTDGAMPDALRNLPADRRDACLRMREIYILAARHLAGGQCDSDRLAQAADTLGIDKNAEYPWPVGYGAGRENKPMGRWRQDQRPIPAPAKSKAEKKMKKNPDATSTDNAVSTTTVATPQPTAVPNTTAAGTQPTTAPNTTAATPRPTTASTAVAAPQPDLPQQPAVTDEEIEARLMELGDPADDSDVNSNSDSDAGSATSDRPACDPALSLTEDMKTDLHTLSNTCVSQPTHEPKAARISANCPIMVE